MTAFIYLLVHKETQAPLYVGKIGDCTKRFKEHERFWLSHHGMKIEIVTIDQTESENWSELEDEWIRYFKEFCKIENRNHGGRQFPDSASRKGGLANKGQKRPSISKAKLGHETSEETRRKISESKKGKPHPQRPEVVLKQQETKRETKK